MALPETAIPFYSNEVQGLLSRIGRDHRVGPIAYLKQTGDRLFTTTTIHCLLQNILYTY